MARQMKDSGIEWIGRIPEDWKITSTKRLFELVAGSTPRSEVAEYWDGDIIWITPADYKTVDKYVQNGRRNITEEGMKSCSTSIIPENSIIFSKRAPVGSVAINTVPLCTNQGCISCVPKENANPVFYYYLMSIFTEQYELFSSGTTFKEISSTNFGDFKVVLPYIDEQQKIADFLDEKVGEIDNVIETTKATIEDYKKYKQSVITEAVTKGLNPDVEMKDSGITYIGRIPENWDITKLKYLFESGDGCLKIGPFGSAIKGKTLDNGPYKIYNQAHLIQNDFSLSRHFVSEETYKELFSYRVLPDDILFSMMGTIGKCRIVPQGLQEGIMDSHLLKARLNTKINVDYFQYVYDKDNSLVVISQLLEMSNGSIMNGLNSTIVKNIVIPLPPIEEQIKIVDYLHEKCTEIDKLISAKEQLIEDMESYKKSLIYEYVTGKKEVE